MDPEGAFERVQSHLSPSSQNLSALPTDCLSLALLVATRRGNSRQAIALLTAGAYPDQEDDFGYTALMFAAARGLYDCVEQILLSPGYIVNKRAHTMQTALHLAAGKGQSRIVEQLIKARGIVNASDDWGETPLLAAVKFGCPETVETLLNNGAKMEMVDLQGFNAITHAARCGFADVLKLLIAQEFDCTKVTRTTPLHQAAMFGHVSCVNLLIKAGFNASVRDIHGQLPVELATQTDQVNVVSLFLDNGISLEDQNATVTACAKYNASDSLNELFSRGASTEGCDTHGVPALYIAIAHNNRNIVKLLIQNNVNVNRSINKMYLANTELREICNSYTDDTLTPIVLAVLSGYDSLVKMLVCSGASFGICFCNRISDNKEVDANLLEETRQWMRKRCHTPRNLTDLCRLIIRDALCETISMKISILPLPKPLQEYLQFFEIEYFQN